VQFVADGSGRLSMPQSPCQLLLVVVDGERRGLALVAPNRGDDELEITVGPVRTLTVEVRDEHGRPAPGAWVKLDFERDGEVENLGRLRTDDTGRAIFHGPDLVAGSSWRGAGLFARTSDLAGQTSSTSDRFEFPTLPTDLIKLDVAAGVDVALELVDSRGHVIEPLGSVLSSLSFELPELSLYASAMLVEGRLVARRLPLDALCQLPEPRGKSMAGFAIPGVQFRTPAARAPSGTPSGLMIPIDFDGLAISGRIVDAAGQPQVLMRGHGNLHGAWENQPRDSRVLQGFQTEASGRFTAYAHPLPQHIADAYGSRIFRILEVSTYSGEPRSRDRSRPCRQSLRDPLA
jgi:hypothetical protein